MKNQRENSRAHVKGKTMWLISIRNWSRLKLYIYIPVKWEEDKGKIWFWVKIFIRE